MRQLLAERLQLQRQRLRVGDAVGVRADDAAPHQCAHLFGDVRSKRALGVLRLARKGAGGMRDRERLPEDQPHGANVLRVNRWLLDGCASDHRGVGRHECLGKRLEVRNVGGKPKLFSRNTARRSTSTAAGVRSPWTTPWACA